MTLVDSDILIDAGRRVPEAIACLRQVVAHSTLAVSVVTQMELMVGCRDKAEMRRLDRFLGLLHVAKLTEVISDRAIELLRAYRLSHGLLLADSLIAATALTMDIPLVSKNQRDYRFIDGLNLLPYP